MKKLKILHTMTWLAKGGGVDNNVYITISELQNEFDFHLLVGKEIYHQEFKKIKNLKLIVCNSLVRKISLCKDIKALLFIYRQIKKEKYDIVHTHETKASLLTRIAAYFACTPFTIYGLHGVTFNDPLSPIIRKLFILIERYTVFCCDYIIVVGKQIMDIYYQNHIAKNKPFAIVRSGMNLQSFLYTNSRMIELYKNKFNYNSKDFWIINIGRFSYSKAQRYTIKAFAKVKERIGNAKLLLIGEGELMSACKCLVKQLNIQNDVVFLGFSKDIPELLSIADLCILTSLREGLPRVVVESYLMKIPVVCFNVEGVREVIEQNKTGFIVPQGDVKQLSEYIVKLAQNKKLREEFGEVGFQKVIKQWDKKIMVNQLRQIYLNQINYEYTIRPS